MKTTIHNFLQKVRALFPTQQLEPREKIVLIAGGCFVFLFVSIQFIITPYIESRDKMILSIARYQQELINIKQLSKQYSQQDKNQNTIVTKIANRANNFSLFTFLEKQSETAGVKNKVKYMKPSLNETPEELDEAIVEMKVQGLTLEDLVNFLQLTESEKNVVFIRKMTLQADEKSIGLISAVIHFSTFLPIEKR